VTAEAKQEEVESPPDLVLSQQAEQKEQLLKTPEQAAPRPDKAAQG
jgi:hypothetical protein